MPRVFTALSLWFAFAGLFITSTAFGALPSIHDRSAWVNVLEAKDLAQFTNMLARAKDSLYPSVPNQIALDVALNQKTLPAQVREAASIPEFRLEALSYLALAHRNKVMTGYSAPLRSLAKQYPTDSRALRALAHFQDRRDVPFLVQAARAKEPNHYRPAMVALGLMCVEESRVALREIGTSSADQTKREFVAQASQMDALCNPPGR